MPHIKLSDDVLGMIVSRLARLARLARRSWPHFNEPCYCYHAVGGLAVCSRKWSRVVGIVMNTLDVPGIRAEKLLSMRRYIMFKLDLSFLFVTFEATAQKELGLYHHWTLTANLCDGDDDDYVPQTLLWHIVRDFSGVRSSYREGLKKVFLAAATVYKQARQSRPASRAVCVLLCCVLSACCMLLQFLLVKGVEALVLKASPSASASRWTDPSAPSVLIGLLWQTHMQSFPDHYNDMCSALLGTTGVLDHTPCDHTPRDAIQHDSSPLVEKMRTLFPGDRGFPFNASVNPGSYERKMVMNDKERWILDADDECERSFGPDDTEQY